ncbi:hypothetical protein D3C80_1454460 [compost metagenome]
MKEFQPVCENLPGIVRVGATLAHGEHGGNNATFTVVFVDIDIAAPIMHGRIVGQDFCARFRIERLGGREKYFLDAEAFIEVFPATDGVGAGREDHLFSKHSAPGRSHGPFPGLWLDILDRGRGKHLPALCDNGARKATCV